MHTDKIEFRFIFLYLMFWKYHDICIYEYGNLRNKYRVIKRFFFFRQTPCDQNNLKTFLVPDYDVIISF